MTRPGSEVLGHGEDPSRHVDGHEHPAQKHQDEDGVHLESCDPNPRGSPGARETDKMGDYFAKNAKKISFTKRLIYKVSMYMFSYYEGVNLSEGQDYVTDHCQVYRVFIL